MGTRRHERRPECHTRGPSRHAFTLVELLAVIAIIGLLAALLMPAVQSARESARRSICTNNLKQLGIALAGYEGQHRRFPAAGRGYSWCYSGPVAGMPGWGSFDGDNDIYNSNGLVEILPFLDQINVFNRFDLEQASNDCGGPSLTTDHWDANRPSSTRRTTMQVKGNPAQNVQASTTPLAAFRCPSDYQQQSAFSGLYGNMPSGVSGTIAATNYDFICATRGQTAGDPTSEQTCNWWRKFTVERRMFGQNTRTASAHVRDGLSNVMAMGETTVRSYRGMSTAWGLRCHMMLGIDPPAGINDWTTQVPAPQVGVMAYTTIGAASLHPGGMNILMGDGVVRFVNEGAAQAVVLTLARIRDGKSDPLE